jgi:Xaa-Pro dipeptidase
MQVTSDQRYTRLSAAIRDRDLDCLVLVPGANLTYVTGLTFFLGDRPTAGYFFPDRPPALVLPVLEAPKAAGLDLELFTWSDEAGYTGAFQRAAGELGLAGRRIGVEAFTMRVVELQLLEQTALAARLIPADGVVAGLRMRKDLEEVEQMRRAADLAQRALQTTLAEFQVGMTERRLASMLKIALLEAGAEGLPFDPIVAAGPNAANPHGHPTDRPVQEGDFLLFDWGATVNGYCSDITRTYPVGRMEPEMRTIYDLVLASNQAGQKAVRPGASCEQVDAAARHVIDHGGYGGRFFHRTGHGLGMQGHEPPSIVAGNDQVLELGMTFTIEPGIYLAGRNGVRIEDDMVVTEEGSECLTTLCRDWIPVG